MRFIHFFVIFILFVQSLYTQDNALIKSPQALLSDEIYSTLIQNNLEPKIQVLSNSLSTNFPYNILLEFNTQRSDENLKKLVFVFQQSYLLNFNEIVSLTNTIKNSSIDYAIDILFTANDINALKNTKLDIPHIPQGSNTYIQSIVDTNNMAAIIVNDSSLKSNTETFSLFSDSVEITPGGIVSTGESTIVPLGFFSTVIDSFAKSNILYNIKGYFLSLYQLNLIADDDIIGIWLENEIPAISLSINENNTKNVFTILSTILEEFSTTNFDNLDTNYGFIQVFSQAFFISERLLLFFILSVSAVVLFGFFNFSFIRGSHRHIHKAELKRTWYLIPVMVLSTGLFLYVAQVLIQEIVPKEPNLVLISFILKILFSILFLLLFSFLQYLIKVPLTGFIYAYTLSLSAILNIIIFSLVEITLAPLFVGQYIVVQFSQSRRKIIPIVLCLICMMLPYFPLVFNIVNINNILNVESIMNASLGMNMLLAFFMLPFQLMVIRILTRLKLWGMRVKTNKVKIIKESIIIVCVTVFVLMVTVVIFQIYTSSSNKKAPANVTTTNSLHITHTEKNQFGNTLNNIEIFSNETVIKYTIELQSENAIPIYDANFPYDILTKPFSAIFALDDYPPNPLQLSYTTQNNNKITYIISAWVVDENGMYKLYIEQTTQDKT